MTLRYSHPGVTMSFGITSHFSSSLLSVRPLAAFWKYRYEVVGLSFCNFQVCFVAISLYLSVTVEMYFIITGNKRVDIRLKKLLFARYISKFRILWPTTNSVLHFGPTCDICTSLASHRCSSLLNHHFPVHSYAVEQR